MASKVQKIDRIFFIATLLLVAAGFFIFSSASLGLLAREGISYTNVALKQIGVIIFGLAIMFTLSRIDYTIWRKYALPIFITSLLLTILVFVPHIGFGYNGARRWIGFGSYTFQPGEFLKIGVVMYLAAWLTKYRQKLSTLNYGLIPFLCISGLVSLIMLKQPDTGTFLVMFAALLSMFIIAGAEIKHILAIIGIGILGVGLLAVFRPYVMARFTTFLHPAADALGSGYQIQQALIAVGSGGFTGRGFGQSIQKFNFLPEPIGDSIFAVASEEFGFIGMTILILLFLFFTLRAFKIASYCKEPFGGLLAIGLAILISAQACINIGSMLGLMPLTGIPLSFISHGGSALLFTLAEAGILLNISKSAKK